MPTPAGCPTVGFALASPGQRVPGFIGVDEVCRSPLLRRSGSCDTAADRLSVVDLWLIGQLSGQSLVGAPWAYDRMAAVDWEID